MPTSEIAGNRILLYRFLLNLNRVLRVHAQRIAGPPAVSTLATACASLATQTERPNADASDGS